jgi:mRNA interferase YafQ
MMYQVTTTNKFNRDLKKCFKQGKNIDLLQSIVLHLASGKALPPKNKDHFLKGNWKGFKECHIQPDWLLIYLIDDANREITLTRTGSHSELF